MDVQLIQRLDYDHDAYVDRRQVIRALAAARRRLEDERGHDCNFDEPRAQQLIEIVADIKLDTLEAIEALGAELCTDRLWMKLIPQDQSVDECNAWMDERRESTIATVRVGEDLR